MPEKISEQIVKAIREVEAALVSEDYRKIGLESRPSRLSAPEIKAALHNYGEGKATPAPEDTLNQLEIIKIRDSKPPRWHVDLDLWIEGQRSDLTLSLSIVVKGDGELIALVDDLHVQ